MQQRAPYLTIGILVVLVVGAGVTYLLTEKDPIEEISAETDRQTTIDDAAPRKSDRPRRNDDRATKNELGDSNDGSTAVRPDAATSPMRDPGTPSIIGRALFADGKTPAAGASITSMVARKDPDPSTAEQKKVGADGRFAIMIGRCDAKVTLHFLSADSKKAKSLVIEKNFSEDENVGDVILDERGAIDLLVTERASGQPIAGAIATLGSEGTNRSRPTDAEGKTTLLLRAGYSAPAERFVVAAPGYRQTIHPAPNESTPDPFAVTLERTTRVRFTAKTPAGTCPKVSVRLSAQGLFIAASAQRSFGNTSWSMTSEGTIKTLEMELVDAEGVVINDIVTDRPIKVELIDRFGGSIEKREFTLRAEEWRDEHFDVVVPAKSLSVEVIDTDEKPVSGAVVTRAQGGRILPIDNQRLPGTDALGKFELTDIYGSPIDLAVTAPGYVEFLRRGIVLSSVANRVRFVLEKSVDIIVIVRGVDGKPIDRIPVEATATGFRTSAVREGEGRYLLSGVPRANLTISAIFAQKSYTAVANGDAEVTITIPAHGTLRIAGDFRPESAPKATVVVEPIDGGGTPLQRIAIPPAEQKFGNSVVIPNLLPARYLVRLEIIDPATGAVSNVGDPIEAAVRADAEVRVDVAPN